MQTREEFEKLEEKMLASYAMKSRDSQRRVYPEKEHPYRTCFQRDRDRVIHCSAFRKLEYKTQVFVNSEGDYYRTRLTHTLEVAQISRSIARALRLNEDLTEAIALAHDLGHTPYGHSGEEVLHKLMRKHGGSFEHNIQGWRIVTELEERYPDFKGLNLTPEVREGILKHKTDYDQPNIKEFRSEKSPTLEAQLVNVADEIAYTSHDFDDGITSGYLTEEKLQKAEIWKGAYEKIKNKYPSLKKEMLKYQTVRFLINEQVSDLIVNTSSNIVNKKINTVKDARNNKTLVSFSQEMTKKNKYLKNFLFNELYSHYKVKRMGDKAEKFISELFNAYVNHPWQLPLEEQKKIKNIESKIKRIEAEFKKGKSTGLRALDDIVVVCDYIAGMTDRSAHDEYIKLFMP